MPSLDGRPLGVCAALGVADTIAAPGSRLARPCARCTARPPRGRFRRHRVPSLAVGVNVEGLVRTEVGASRPSGPSSPAPPSAGAGGPIRQSSTVRSAKFAITTVLIMQPASSQRCVARSLAFSCRAGSPRSSRAGRASRRRLRVENGSGSRCRRRIPLLWSLVFAQSSPIWSFRYSGPRAAPAPETASGCPGP